MAQLNIEVWMFPHLNTMHFWLLLAPQPLQTSCIKILTLYMIIVSLETTLIPWQGVFEGYRAPTCCRVQKTVDCPEPEKQIETEQH